MQMVTSKRSVSKFTNFINLSTVSRDTSKKCYVNASFDIYNTTQNNEVSLGWRHLETLQRHLNIFWRHFGETLQRHFRRQQPSAKCLRVMSLDLSIIEFWRHFVSKMLSIGSTGLCIKNEVSPGVSKKPKLSLRSVSEMSPNSTSFYEVSPECEVLSWQF